MKARLQHVSIPRPPGSEDATRQFYGGVLGLEEKPVPTSIQHRDLIWYSLGEDAELHVYADADINGPTRQHFCMVVDDLDSLRKRLIDAGYDPQDGLTVFGRPRFYCRDPFENLIEFTLIEDDYMRYQGQLAEE